MTLASRSGDHDRDLIDKVSRPWTRPWHQGVETVNMSLASRSRDLDRDLGIKVSRPWPRPWRQGLETTTKRSQTCELECCTVHPSFDTLVSGSQHCLLLRLATGTVSRLNVASVSLGTMHCLWLNVSAESIRTRLSSHGRKKPAWRLIDSAPLRQCLHSLYRNAENLLTSQCLPCRRTSSRQPSESWIIVKLYRITCFDWVFKDTIRKKYLTYAKEQMSSPLCSLMEAY